MPAETFFRDFELRNLRYKAAKEGEVLLKDVDADNVTWMEQLSELERVLNVSIQRIRTTLPETSSAATLPCDTGLLELAQARRLRVATELGDVFEL